MRGQQVPLFSSVSQWGNGNNRAATAGFFKRHIAFRDGKNRVVFAHADIIARVPFGTALADNDIARNDMLATEFFDTKAATG